MPFRSITADPADLQKLADAFDAAWIAVNQPTPIEASARPAERERLSHIIMSVWQRDPQADLAETAVQAFNDGSAPIVLPRRQSAG
ncbi:hypothetical protein ABIE41_000165 [Bosea sp. OAE506]